MEMACWASYVRKYTVQLWFLKNTICIFPMKILIKEFKNYISRGISEAKLC